MIDLNSQVPFLKWAGGKRWLAERYPHFFASNFKRFVEPFLGSGAVFFKLAPQKALLSDSNQVLIRTYCTVRDEWRHVLRHLNKHQRSHSHTHYYRVRELKPRSPYTEAARLIYLNRTCWNGLYRVNKLGEFNVPIGTKVNVVLNSDDFAGVSKLLSRAEIKGV